MKVLVTGVKGQLGYDVVNELEKRGHTAIGTDVEEMDITDEGKVREVLDTEKPDAVIHCAAYTRSGRQCGAVPEDQRGRHGEHCESL